MKFTGHPGFAHSLQPAIVPLGGTAVFECPVLSNPPADVGWTFQDGTPITSGIKYVISPATTLSITDVQATDERFYVCTATNTFGRNSTSARLAIGSKLRMLDSTYICKFTSQILLTGVCSSVPNPFKVGNKSLLNQMHIHICHSDTVLTLPRSPS